MSLAELTESKPWFTQNFQLPQSPSGMMGSREALLCYYLARDAFRGSGTIVDAGSFLGMSAFHFAEGLRANPRPASRQHRVHCFDNFLVNEIGTVRFIRAELNQTLAIGDSTRALFDSQVASVASLLEVHSGDFHTIQWSPEPIEILMVDIAKSESLGKRVLDAFFPHLIGGESVVIQQDYHHPWLPHIHIAMEYLSDYFEIVAPRVDDSAVFRYRAAIPPEVLRRAIAYAFSHEEKLRLMDRAIERLPGQDRFLVELARVVLQFQRAPEGELRKEVDEIEARFREAAQHYPKHSYFDDVRTGLDEMEAWRCKSDGDFEHCLRLADKVLARQPNTNSMTLRGGALLGLGRYREAEEQLRPALDMQPLVGWTRFEMARAIMAQNRLADAELEILRGLRDVTTTPVPSRAYVDLLWTVWSLEGPPKDKRAVLASLLREFPDDPEIRVLQEKLNGVGQ